VFLRFTLPEAMPVKCIAQLQRIHTPLNKTTYSRIQYNEDLSKWNVSPKFAGNLREPCSRDSSINHNDSRVVSIN